ncbi:hypothetical protein E2320_011913 [Naja naja]|nr:hypothetical protein E2320_011913 [Naja naja]
MHRRHCQPVEVNIECVAALPSKRLKWSREDDEALRRHSDHLWKTGILKKELYTLLLPHFPGCLQEAVKKRLQTIKWLPPSDPAPVCHPPPEVGTETIPVSGPDLLALSSASTSASGSDPAATWMTTLLEVATLNVREAKMGADELSETARDLLSGEISQSRGRALLQDHAQHWFPHTWRPSKHDSSLEQMFIRRANYASIQQFYKLRRRDAASSVFSGQWKNTYHGS